MTSVFPSNPPSISDLDGYTLRDYTFPMSISYVQPDQDEFGFDPPTQPFSKTDRMKGSPHDDDFSLSDWPGFEPGDTPITNVDASSSQLRPQYPNKLVIEKIPNLTTTVSRYGQITPPRSNSATSSKDDDAAASPKSATPERRKRTKAQAKDSEPAPAPAPKPGRKRKNARKTSASQEDVTSADDVKRKQSLEKNRLAAAKCRVNKKEKTEQLQRDSHDKAIQNSFLRDQVMRMKDQVQQMNAILLAHANCDGCKSPEEIQRHLQELGNDFFAQQMTMQPQDYEDFSQMDLSDLVSMSRDDLLHDGYFGPPSHGQGPSMLHPPLPEFDRSAEFEVHTPMQTD